MAETDGARLARLRQDLPSLAGVTFLNSGTYGPVPRPVSDAVRAAAAAQLERPRIGRDYFGRVAQAGQSCREALAGLLGCEAGEVALTHNTTEGMNFITLGVNWARGDEAITTDVEHPGGLLPLWVVRDRYGVTVKTAGLLRRPPDPVDAVIRLITPRTKLISLSHVSWATGDVLPLAEIAREAHERGVLVCVDGAQSFGAMDVDVSGLGVDFYAVPGQKWLCGPDGTGALYCSQQAISQIRTTFAGYATLEAYNDHSGFVAKGDARRFEVGTANLPARAGLLAAATWMSEAVGARWAHRRIHELAALARARLADLGGVEVVTGEEHAGLVTFRAAGPGDSLVSPEDLVARLASRSVLVRSIRRPAAVRLAAGFFLTEAEVEAAVAAVGEELAVLRKGS